MKQTVECKSLGIQLREDVARDVDALVRTLPKDSAYRYRQKGRLPDAAELVKGEKADISLVSTEDVDRENEVVLARGMDVAHFQKNPVVFFAHRMDEPPIGKAAWIKKVPGGLRAKTVYTDATEFAKSVWQMTKEGILRGKSIGFLPTRIRGATHDEIHKNPSWKSASVIESAVMLEFSIAPVPMNPAAIIEAVAKGRADAATLKRLGIKVPSDVAQKRLADVIAREFERAAKRLHPDEIERRIMESYRA